MASAHLAENTIGAAFLGTPFEGSSKAAWAKTGLRLLNYFSATNKESVTDLEERSAKLLQINEAFQKFLNVRSRSETRNFMEVAYFFEAYPMFKLGKQFIVPKDSACGPSGTDPLPIAADHRGMCKFEHEYVEGFKAVTQKVNQWIDEFNERKNDADSKQKASNLIVVSGSSPNKIPVGISKHGERQLQ